MTTNERSGGPEEGRKERLDRVCLVRPAAVLALAVWATAASAVVAFLLPLAAEAATLDQGFDVSVTRGNMEARVVDYPSGDTLLFYFDSPNNPEVMVKVLRGCLINGHWFVSVAAATDLQLEVGIRDRNGGTWTARFADGHQSLSTIDVSAFPCGFSSSATSALDVAAEPERVATTVTLNNRFEANVHFTHHRDGEWVTDPAGHTDLAGDSATLFWLFNRHNPEMLFRVVDGCATNGHWWVFGAAVTDLRLDVTVRDTTTGRSRVYVREFDLVGIADRTAFPCDGSAPVPDLVVESPRSTETSVAPGGTFRFAATVRNGGDSRSSATTLRYYRSSDSRITTSDTTIGTDAIGALSASATDRQSIGQRAPSTAGTYYYGACVDAVSGESDTTNNCSTGVRVTVGTGGGPATGTDFDLDASNADPLGITVAQGRIYVVDRADGKVYAYSVDGSGGGAAAPDLVVESPRSTESSLAPGGAFRFAATVRNSGDERSPATTLRYYRSSDSRITTSDTAIGTDAIGALSASATDRQSIGRQAPATPGTYYYGACVDAVAGESDTTNNCSSGVRVTVSGGGSSAPDLVVSSPSVSNSSPSAGGRFTLRATVRNQGDGRSASTTLRYYRSSNSTISSSDTQVGTDAVSALSASGSSAESVSLTAPSNAGTYYYGACVDSVSGESSTGNNCSSGVRVTVSGGGSSGTRYRVGDVVATLPTGFFVPSLSGCSFRSSGGNVTIQCSRNGSFWTQSYRYTCEASTCGIENRVVTQGVWLETRM